MSVRGEEEEGKGKGGAAETVILLPIIIGMHSGVLAVCV